MTLARRQRWYIAAIVALVIARLILISHDEIVTATYDEGTYIGAAGAWYWKNQYNTWSYTRQPGYPLFLAIGSLLGVPARLAIEALWISVSLLIIRVARRASVRRGLCLLLFALLVFHPFTTELFCHVLSENLYTAMLLAMLVSMATAITSRSKSSVIRWGALAGAAAAITGVTRQETVLVYLLTLFAGAIVVKTWLLKSVPRRLALRRLAFGCLMPLCMALATEHAVRAANLARIGGYVTYDWSLPGFKALYRTMLSIPPADPNPRVPIPRDVREKAATASPTYARLLEVMMNHPRCTPYRGAGERTTGVVGEPGSYNLWLMREAAWILHDDNFKSARQTDEFFMQIVRELREAQSRGDLGRRWAPMSFIPPDWVSLAKGIVSSFPACWSAMTHIGFDRAEPADAIPINRDRFDAVSLRRSALLKDEPAYGVHLHRKQVVARFDAVKRAIAATLPALSVVGLLIAIAGGITAQFLRKKLPPAWYAATALLCAAFILRFLLAATLDATGVLAWNRYLFPNSALLVPLAVLGLHACFVMIRTRLDSSRTTSA